MIAFDDLLSRLQGAKKNGTGYKSRCPAHDDREPSLSISTGTDGRILLKCHAGCTFDDITRALGLQVADMFPDRDHQPEKRERPTVARLAAVKRLPEAWLRELGLSDIPDDGVAIPYRDADGNVLATKRRTDMVAKKGSLWERGTPLSAYGIDRLADAREHEYLVLVEGESDCWTLWHHSFPALGLPGADTVEKTLHAPHVDGIKRVYFTREPDKGGEIFSAAVPKRLRAIGFKGRIVELQLEGAKDPSDLHVQDPENFKARFEKAMQPADAVKIAVDAARDEWSRIIPPAISTGLVPLDDMLGGGLQESCTYVLAGLSGRGKSGLAIQIARAVAAVRPVVYVSSELPRRAVLARAAAQIKNAPWRDIYKLEPAGTHIVTDALSGLALYVVELGKDESVTGACDRIAEVTGQVPVLILDYLQHAARRGMPADYRLAVAALSDSVVRWARDAHSIALVVSSVARGNSAAEASETDARAAAHAPKESGDVEYDASGVLFLSVGEREPDGTSPTRLVVGKSRFGVDGVVGMRFHGSVGTFTLAPEAALTEVEQDVLDAIRNGDTAVAEIAKTTGRRRVNIASAVRRLANNELIVPISERGGWRCP